jgi:cyanophycinase-like exopeptidase
MRGAIALVGSGEYLPVMRELENELLQNSIKHGNSDRYIQIPTAAGQESSDRLSFWQDLGARQADALGVEPVFLPIFDREAAMNQSFAEEIKSAGLIYLSGGDPGYLAQTLIDTPVWQAIEAALENGSSLAGCSAGAMALGKYVPNFFRPRESGTTGLSTIGEIRTIPHYDKFFKWIPDRAARLLLTAPPGTTVIGIDESTALVTGLSNDPEITLVNRKWRVQGVGMVHLLNGDRDSAQKFKSGEVLAI